MSSSKPFRIAVCFSGQLRHWRTAVNNIKKFFEFKHPHPVTGQKVQTDYFVHTWDINTWRLPKTDHSIYEERPHDDMDDFCEAYNPISYILEEWDKESFPLAWDPMFYSFERSLLLKRDHEIRNGFDYDIVIKVRPDVVYNPAVKFPIGRVWPMTCYTVTPVSRLTFEFNYPNFDDVMFYGDSPTMDAISDIYDVHNTQFRTVSRDEQLNSLNANPNLFYGPGALLYEHMTNLGIHPEGNRVVEYAVVRDTSAELDGVEDYAEIRKRWFEWYI